MTTNDETVVDYLEKLARTIGIQVRHEVIKQDKDSGFVVEGL